MSEFTSVTRCPHCETSFHLGPMQLEAAGGKVRCGACLNIFDAREHFLVEQKHLFDSLPLPLPRQYLDHETGKDMENEEGMENEGLEEDISANPEDLYPLITDESGRPRRVWPGLALLAALLIPVQIFWWQPPALLQQSWYQDWLQRQCDWLPCAHTDIRDLEYLTLSGLIRPSTTHQQVLTARIELRNRAPLPQPFPALAIRFTDIRGNPVATRYLSPAEYLQNEASNRQSVAAGQRVQIELQLYDPGREAVSYEFEPVYLRESSQR